MKICVHTNFKRRTGGVFKRFRVEGLAAGRGFVLEMTYDSGSEYIMFDGSRLPPCPSLGRHRDIILNSWRWHCGVDQTSQQPDADFAWLVFGLSAALWTSCHEGRKINIGSELDLRWATLQYPLSLAKRQLPRPSVQVAQRG